MKAMLLSAMLALLLYGCGGGGTDEAEGPAQSPSPPHCDRTPEVCK